MALKITAIERHNGGACDHISVTLDQEGTTRTFDTHLKEIDSYFDDLSLMEQLKLLVILWAKYRRSVSRAILNVEIA